MLLRELMWEEGTVRIQEQRPLPWDPNKVHAVQKVKSELMKVKGALMKSRGFSLEIAGKASWRRYTVYDQEPAMQIWMLTE